jgi:hypothetical protein
VSGDFNVQIMQKGRELTVLCSLMEDTCQKFLEETGVFAALWYKQMAIVYITKYPETTISLGKEKLVELKTKINDLSKKSKQIVNTTLCGSKIWWHKDPQLNVSFSEYDQLGDQQVGRKYPITIDKYVRAVLGELGVVLEEFNFDVATNPSKSGFQEFWFVDVEENAFHTLPYFPHLLDWSDDMQGTLRVYAELFKKGLKLISQIQELKDEKKRLDIVNIWESIPA